VHVLAPLVQYIWAHPPSSDHLLSLTSHSDLGSIQPLLLTSSLFPVATRSLRLCCNLRYIYIDCLSTILSLSSSSSTEET
jgi:hypothetical protein